MICRGWALGLMAAAAILWAAFTGELAVTRHMALQTNAFDLGYVSQALWYDAHGEPFRFTTIQGVSALLEGVDASVIKHPHWLLAFHVEPALLALAPLYRLWPDPRVLLWLQAMVVAAGAVPAAMLGRRVVGGWPAGLVFGFAWLLAPGLEGAVLSDFHMVAVGAALLMLALWLYEAGHSRWALACFALAALTREDAAAAVAWLGIVLLLRDRLRGAGVPPGYVPDQTEAVRPGDGGSSMAMRSQGVHVPRHGAWLRTAIPAWADGARVPMSMVVGAGMWAAVSIGLIEPFFSGGASAFGARYAWLQDAVRGGHLGAILGWFGQPEVLAYLGLQLLTGGIVALLAPIELLAALPLLAVNALSSFDWMRSGGGHYSALLAPLLLWAAMHGVQRLTCWAGKPARPAWLTLVMACAVGAQAWVGASPLHPNFGWPAADGRGESVLRSLDGIPATASVSASSALYPHLSARHDAYWFPAINGADWLALDVAGTTHPLSPVAMRDAALRQLSRPDVELAEARDGLLVIHRRPVGERGGLLANDPAERTLGAVVRDDPAALPADFYGFATRTGPMTAIGPVRFGPALELIGFDVRRWPEVGLLGSSADLKTYWRATAAIQEDLHFGLATSRAGDGALSGIQDDASPTPLWLPTSHWRPGQVMRLDMSLGQVREVQAAGVMVEDRTGRRLPAAGEGVVLWDGGSIAEVARLG